MKYFHEYPYVSFRSGSTAIVVLIVGDRIISANCGDSRALLCRKGVCINLSVD